MTEDDRMDRARRIRELREGTRGRGGSDDTPDEPQENEPDSAGEETDSDDNDSPDSEGDSAGADDADGDDGSEAAPADNGDADGETDADGEDADGTDDAEGDEAEESDDGALAAAQAAAAAASQFEGEGSVTMDLEGKDALPDDVDPEEVAPAGATVADSTVTETAEERTRILEFRLGEERYCLDIEYVEEIVREESVTRVPNTPEYVSGVVDLRGQITTILDPTTGIDAEHTDGEQLIIVFDDDAFDDYGTIGWLVDAVDQVTPITDDDVRESPIQEPYINGVIERDDEFVIWTSPEMALDIEDDE